MRKLVYLVVGFIAGSAFKESKIQSNTPEPVDGPKLSHEDVNLLQTDSFFKGWNAALESKEAVSEAYAKFYFEATPAMSDEEAKRIEESFKPKKPPKKIVED